MIERVNRGYNGSSHPQMINPGCEALCKKACASRDIDGWAYTIGILMDP